MFRRDHRVDALFSLTNARACGVGTIFVSGRFRQQAHCTFGANGRMLLLDLNISGKRIRFVDIYAPVTRSHTNAFFKDLHQFLLEPLPHVILGDFNCVVDSLRDVRGPGQGGSTTTASRIDRAYHPDYLLPSVAECEVLALPSTLAGRTDHFPLTITLRGSPGPRNDNLRLRLDPTLLEDEISVERIKGSLRETLRYASPMTPQVWDTLKEAWKSILQEGGRARKRRLTDQMNELLRRMRIIRGAETLTACTRDYLDCLEASYARLLKKKTRKPVKAAGQSYAGTEAKRPDGSVTTDPNEIEAIFRNYFRAQFQATDSGDAVPSAQRMHELCKHLQRPAEEEFTTPCGEAVMDELVVAIRNMPSNSAPGVDGSRQAARVRHLDLTLREKALIAKTSIFAFANYACRVAVMPSKTANQINKITGSLPWDDKPAPKEGGLGLPHVMTVGKVLALKTARFLYQASDYIGKGLFRYWCSTNTGLLDADRHLGPLAEFPSAFYKAAVNTKRMVDTEVADCDVDKDPPARIVEELTRRQKCNTSFGKGTGRSSQPKNAYTGSASCPPPTAPTAVQTTLDRNRGAFAKLVVACTLFIIWKRRCLAAVRKRTVRAANPAVSRVRMLVWKHLMEELEASGEERFLRRWHTKFFFIREGQVADPITPY
ncbi:hypothetical protein HPB52_020755 [Rhipicephalus sanguineus]|uniref:Tick transposon n=1 Tax=Rhipicephalus sanguineus TaxID=34632 RepID=A0A9D4PGM3_RHISA|nr:hypothetical protein HPB52_020755 [Rhipicephalus sanguineus]